MTKPSYTHYYDQIGQNKIDAVIGNLLQGFPAFRKELVLLQSRYTANEKRKNTGTIQEADYRVESNNIIGSLLAFIDSLAKGKLATASTCLQKKKRRTNPC